MTSKKRRQRGSRTHSGGSHKNRRGAGHRGGRGKAGRAKHEFHNHPPLGEEKAGFSRPEQVQEEVLEIDVREIDENAALWAADGLVEATDGGFQIDVRDIVDDGHDADVVKLLGGGQVRNELTIVADDFSESAREKVEDAGGTVELSERGEQRQAESQDGNDSDEDDE